MRSLLWQGYSWVGISMGLTSYCLCPECKEVWHWVSGGGSGGCSLSTWVNGCQGTRQRGSGTIGCRGCDELCRRWGLRREVQAQEPVQKPVSVTLLRCRTWAAASPKRHWSWAHSYFCICPFHTVACDFTLRHPHRFPSPLAQPEQVFFGLETGLLLLGTACLEEQLGPEAESLEVSLCIL